MGFRKPQTLYRLKFTDDDMAGLVITTRAPSIDELLKVAPLAGVIDQRTPDLNVLQPLLAMFTGLLVSWNLEEDDDSPVPMTAEALAGLELGFLMKVLNAWAEAVTAVAPPLPAGSANGLPAGLPPIPMTPLQEASRGS